MVVPRLMDLLVLDVKSDYVLREYVPSFCHVFGLAPGIPKRPNKALHVCGASISWMRGANSMPHWYRTDYADTLRNDAK